jgi:hypothetical protein
MVEVVIKASQKMLFVVIYCSRLSSSSSSRRYKNTIRAFDKVNRKFVLAWGIWATTAEAEPPR